MKEMEGDEEEETAGYSYCLFWTAVQSILSAGLGPAAKGGRQASSWPYFRGGFYFLLA